eukprot:CAMPEP_0119355972 /NCGR_PEP_ID=MMETSP1334-20130426/4719_1 /TAXON_ID=127549 /ORGANISM="Calcidiscus leptoporus, Strain RCC1130" /LENGTH=54 /DNA_ID=CAMNT_0007369923 /DNA_START=285 /DNA_END=449 /DNA_ORIENTATION=+
MPEPMWPSGVSGRGSSAKPGALSLGARRALHRGPPARRRRRVLQRAKQLAVQGK